MAVNPRNLAKALKKVGAKGSVRANKKKIVKAQAKKKKATKKNGKFADTEFGQKIMAKKGKK
jgi:hypothetical protein